MIQTLKRALYDDHPVSFLHAVSGLLVATEERRLAFGTPAPRISLDELVGTFEKSDFAATTAALQAIAEMAPDEVMATRIRRTLRTRTHPVPAWLRMLETTEVVEVLEMRHVLRDGENYLLDVRLPDGYAMSVVVYVDNNMGQVVKDAFAIPRPVAEVVEQLADDLDEDTRLGPLDPADARARIEQAVEIGAITFPPLKSDTWPMIRPLVQWLVRLLPEGGSVPEPHEWTDAELDELEREFLESPYGQGYDDADHRSLLRNLTWIGSSYDLADPLRWTPVNIEILLVDRAPRKIIDEADHLAKLPDVLRSFVRFAHHKRGLGPALTAEALAAVDRWEPEYQRFIRDPDRPQGAEALARLLLDASTGGSDDYLADLVGGPEQLGGLHVEPLPDEAFGWSGIPEDVTDKVREILVLCDENAMQFLDVEHRTANRRLLRQVVLADPAFFRGRAHARTSAAAICWMVAHANQDLTPYGPLTTEELLAPFGVKSASQRAKQFRERLGLPEHYSGDGPMALGSSDYLVSARRAEIVEERDRTGW